MNIYHNLSLIENPSRSQIFDMADKVWQNYIKLPNGEKEKEHPALLNFIEKMMLLHDNTDAWTVCFSPDKKLVSQIVLLDQKTSAKKSLENYLNIPENSQKAMLSIISNLLCVYSDEKNFEEYKKVWQDVFKDVKLFKTYVDEALSEKLASRQELINKYKVNNSQPIEESEQYPFSFRVQLSCSTNSLFNHPTFKEHKDFIIEEFNLFKMENYMKIPFTQFRITKSEYSEEDGYLIINYWANKNLDDNDITLLKKELKGQLSDGFGSNMTQLPTLIDDKVTYLRFDYDHLELLNGSVKNKMKP